MARTMAAVRLHLAQLDALFEKGMMAETLDDIAWEK